ncbi:hypothetical protein H4I96_11505 [Botrytis cinerea]
MLAPPIPVQPHLAPAQPNLMDIERRHWAEKIFDDHAQPLSQTLLKHRRDSRCIHTNILPLDSDSESERAIEDLSRPASAGLQ